MPSTILPTQVTGRPTAQATDELTLAGTPSLALSPTPTSRPTQTATATPTPKTPDTATATATSTVTRKPAAATTEQITPASTPLPKPTAATSEPTTHVGLGQYDGCPFLFEGKYVTQPAGGAISMDLVNWALGKQIVHLQSIYRNEKGAVLAVLETGETVNLNAEDHREVTILNVPRAIGTWEDGISWKEVSPDTMYEILIPGVPLYHGNPGWGSTFKVVVGCNQP
jgi:hypothetical protein